MVVFKSLLIGTCENDKNSCDLSLVDLLQQVCHIDHNQESKSLWLDWIFTLGWERASILSQSSSPWSSKTMLLIPVSAFFVKIPSVSISLAVGGFGGISVLRYLYSVLSHCRWVGICWQNSRRSFSSVMPLRTSLSALIKRSCGVLSRVFYHETRGRKELAKTKVVAPNLKIWQSDKLLGSFCKKIHSRFGMKKSNKIP